MTILDMLDILESRVLRLADARPVEVPSASTAAGVATCSMRPVALRAALDQAGLSPLDFANMFGVPVATLHAWMAGNTPMPQWVQTSVQMLGLMSPALRHNVRDKPERNGEATPKKVHPFSKIEDL